MSSRRLLSSAALAAALALLLAPEAQAQIPQLLSYQGRIAVGGVNFNGTGQFRFALVDAAGTTTFWSNDGTSSGGGQPTAPVPIAVANGLYSILLGDITAPNMTAIPAAVFDHPDVRLRIWFNDGANGSQQLTPDQRIAAVGYAVIAGNVPDGSITSAKLAPGAVTAGSIANGAIGSNQLASGAAAANLAASGQAGVASGGVILGSGPNNAALLAAGYVQLGTVNLPDAWTAKAAPNGPTGRYRHTGIWTGTEMIVWGGILTGTGLTPTYLGDGMRYNPATDTWTPVASVSAPTVRAYHTAVWTGTEMIVWGGSNTGGSALSSGGRYNPVANTWSATSATNAPLARRFHAAVWTGTEMLIWGGAGTSAFLGDGARYAPASNTWNALPASGAPSARAYHTAVWTGTEMIVWGGSTGGIGGAVADGARYHRASNTWTATQTLFSPGTRQLHSAAWSGTEMYIWGGVSGAGQNINDGSRYSPATNTWLALPSANAPSKRDSTPALWTGSAFLIWGGEAGGGIPPTDGGLFNPATNSWTPTNTAAAAPARVLHSAVWTGSEMLIFGGVPDPTPNNPTAFNDVWVYAPTRTMYLYNKP